MELLPNSVGSRPRLACEVRPDGVVAACSENAVAELRAMRRVALAPGVVSPSLRSGSVADPEALTRALRQALEGLAGKGAERSRYLSLVIPDAAVRVLLVDFDALPAKASEALPVVRFRLKKLLPFDVDHALVSYQPMPGPAGSVSVLAVAIPRELLAEYESAVVRAGYLPGAVLPSTLAALAGLEGPEAALVVNTSGAGVTTAIVRGGALLLHRTVELAEGQEGGAPASVAVLDPGRLEAVAPFLVAGLPEDPITLSEPPERAVAALNQAPGVSRAREIAQAVSVAAAYFEDTLRAPATEILAAGSMGAEELRELLREQGMDEMRVRDMVGQAAVAAVATAAGGSPGVLAGVRGALRG